MSAIDVLIPIEEAGQPLMLDELIKADPRTRRCYTHKPGRDLRAHDYAVDAAIGRMAI
jgi:hypothetical protein